MLAINHAATGVLLGAYLPLPLAVPLAFASHFVMDSIPHFGIEKPKRNNSIFYKSVIYSDIVLANSLVIAAFWHVPGVNGAYHNWPVFISGYTAASPDFTHVWYYLKNGRTMNVETGGVFSGYHRKLHHVERIWGIIPEVILAAILVTWIFHRL